MAGSRWTSRRVGRSGRRVRPADERAVLERIVDALVGGTAALAADDDETQVRRLSAEAPG